MLCHHILLYTFTLSFACVQLISSQLPCPSLNSFVGYRFQNVYCGQLLWNCFVFVHLLGNFTQRSLGQVCLRYCGLISLGDTNGFSLCPHLMGCWHSYKWKRIQYSVCLHMACSVLFLPKCFLSMVNKIEPGCISGDRRNFYQQWPVSQPISLKSQVPGDKCALERDLKALIKKVPELGWPWSLATV